MEMESHANLMHFTSFSAKLPDGSINHCLVGSVMP